MLSLRKWFRWVSKYLAVAVLVGIPAIAAWGALNPWPPAAVSFAPPNDKIPLLVGMRFKYSNASGVSTRTESRSYLLLPATLSWPRVVTVAQTDRGPVQVSEPSLVGFLGLLGTIAFAMFVVWRSWFRRGNVRAA